MRNQFRESGIQFRAVIEKETRIRKILEEEKMRKWKNVVGMSLVCAMGVTSISGCGTDVKLPKEPADMVKVATERTAALDSYELTGSMDLEASIMGEDIDVDANIHAIYFKEPMKMKMDIEALYGEETMDLSMYFMKENDTYVTYTCVDDQWTKQTIDTTDEEQAKLFKQLETGNLDVLKEYADKVTLAENQEKEGETALSMTITAQDIMKLMETMEMDETMASSGVPVGMFENLGDIETVMSIDNKQVYWKSINIDMTSMMQGLLDTVMSSYGALLGEQDVNTSVTNCTMEMNYDKYNAAAAFELPEEAKNAQEVGTVSVIGGDEDLIVE